MIVTQSHIALYRRFIKLQQTANNTKQFRELARDLPLQELVDSHEEMAQELERLRRNLFEQTRETGGRPVGKPVGNPPQPTSPPPPPADPV